MLWCISEIWVKGIVRRCWKLFIKGFVWTHVASWATETWCRDLSSKAGSIFTAIAGDQVEALEIGDVVEMAD